jgi:hypothetical protein
MARARAAQPYLSLDYYRELMDIPICAFNGVMRPSETLTSCDHFWSQWEREALARHLNAAENLLAQHLGFFIGPRFLTDYDHQWTDPVNLRWGHIVGGGIQGLTDVTAGVVASDFTIDPATITIPQASFPGGTDEIYIIETATGLEINPDKVETSGVNYVIYINQCKLVEWDDLEYQTSDAPIAYDPTFAATVWLKLADLTIYREYLDASTQATITFGVSCRCWCSGEACAGTDRTGCVYVHDEEISKVRVSIATYDASAGTWACNLDLLCGCYTDDKVTVRYRAGTVADEFVAGWQEAVMRLAHTYIIRPPCGCDVFDLSVGRDNAMPRVMTAERLNCPLGMKAGAWFAWNWLPNVKHGHAFMLG